MSLLLSALLQHQNHRKVSLLLKNHCIVNPRSRENLQPARGIALAWKCLRDNLPRQEPRRGEGDAVGRCCENLDNPSSSQTEESAIFQQRLLQPGYSLEKWRRTGKKWGYPLVLTITCSQRYSTSVFQSNKA